MLLALVEAVAASWIALLLPGIFAYLILNKKLKLLTARAVAIGFASAMACSSFLIFNYLIDPTINEVLFSGSFVLFGIFGICLAVFGWHIVEKRYQFIPTYSEYMRFCSLTGGLMSCFVGGVLFFVFL